jgi:hypothetical protein
MPSNPVPNLTQQKLKTLCNLLAEYAGHIHAEQPLAAQIISIVVTWVKGDIQ